MVLRSTEHPSGDGIPKARKGQHASRLTTLLPGGLDEGEPRPPKVCTVMKSLTRPLARNSKPLGYLRSQRYWSRSRILQLPSSAAGRNVSAKRLATHSARSKAKLQAEKRLKPAAVNPQALGQHEQHHQSGDPQNQFAEPAQPDFKRGRRRFSDQCGGEHAQRRPLACVWRIADLRRKSLVRHTQTGAE